MQLKSYKEIQHTLSGLNRREQYVILLGTKEWMDFRRAKISWWNDTCQDCGIIAGAIEEEISPEEWEQLLQKYNQRIHEFDERKKTWTTEQWMQSLLDGTYIGRPGMPCRTRTIGQTILQVHHRLYYFNKLPWQYSNNDIQVLCRKCHKNAHAREIIFTYKDESMSFRKRMPTCPKCEGDGFIEVYRHRDNGICYSCGGEGILYESFPEWEAVN